MVQASPLLHQALRLLGLQAFGLHHLLGLPGPPLLLALGPSPRPRLLPLLLWPPRLWASFPGCPPALSLSLRARPRFPLLWVLLLWSAVRVPPMSSLQSSMAHKPSNVHV